MAAITRRVASSAPVSTRSASRVKPFTAAGRGQRLPITRSRVVVRAEEEETPAAPVEVQEAAVEALIDDDDFSFNLRDAKSANEYQPSDVEAALRFFEEGSGDMPYEADHVTNVTGVEDAGFFDDIDNNEGYEVDEYASAGISEAAPKSKRRGRRGENDADDSDVMSEEMKALEEERLQAAAFDELDLDEDELYGDADPRDAPWAWEDAAGGEEQEAAPKTAWGRVTGPSAAQQEEDTIVASLTTIDMQQIDDVSEADKDLISTIVDIQDLDADAIDYDDADDANEDIGENEPALSQAEEADIDALLGEELGDVPAFEAFSVPAADDDEEVVALDDAEVQAYIKALKALQASDAGIPVEKLGSILEGEEAPVVVAADNEQVAQLGAMPDFKLAPELLKEDAEFEAALDADDAAGVEGLVAELSELAAIPAVEYSAAMFPEDADLEVFEQVLDATEEYAAVAGEDATGDVATTEAEAWYDDVNMYDELPEDLVARASALAAAEDQEEERDLESFAERVLELSRVTKVVKGGKIMGFRAVVVIGDMKGRVGVGCESGREVQTAVKRALVDARKNIIRVPLVGAGTTPHRIEAWFKGAGVVIRPAVEGTGVIAGSSVRSVLELAGVKNVLAKRLGSRSQLNNARVTIKALSMLRTLDDVARARGVPLQYLLQ